MLLIISLGVICNKSRIAGFVHSKGEVSGLKSCFVDECGVFCVYGVFERAFMQLDNLSLVAMVLCWACLCCNLFGDSSSTAGYDVDRGCKLSGLHLLNEVTQRMELAFSLLMLLMMTCLDCSLILTIAAMFDGGKDFFQKYASHCCYISLIVTFNMLFKFFSSVLSFPLTLRLDDDFAVDDFVVDDADAEAFGLHGDADDYCDVGWWIGFLLNMPYHLSLHFTYCHLQFVVQMFSRSCF